MIKVSKILLPKREITHANVQSCPSKEKRALPHTLEYVTLTAEMQKCLFINQRHSFCLNNRFQ